jgi:hypothetical protein
MTKGMERMIYLHLHQDASSTPVKSGHQPRHGIVTAPEQDDVDMSNLSCLFQETSITSSIRKTTTSAANNKVPKTFP